MRFAFDFQPRLPSGWNENRMLLRGKLTDRRIEFYRKKGWYSNEYKEARRELIQRKAAKRAKREGNFLNVDGSLVYNPK